MARDYPHPSEPKAAAIAQRLRAHARLCGEVAQTCWNEATAAELRHMADECARVAAAVDAGRDTRPHAGH